MNWFGRGNPDKKQPLRNVRVVRKTERTRQAVRERVSAWWQARTAEPPPPPVESEDDEIEVADSPTPGWVSWLTFGAAAFCLAIIALAALNLHDFQTRVETGVASKFDTFGHKRVTAKEVHTASGVRWGSPLTAIDRDTVARNIEKLPWVRRADVEAELPNRVIFHVQEYEPYALLMGDDKLLIVDAGGHVFKEAEMGEAGDLPIISGFSPKLSREAHIRFGSEIASPEQRRLQNVLRLIAAHAGSPVAESFPLSEVHYDPVLGTTLVSARDGAEVRLGKTLAGEPERAYALLARVLDQTQKQGEWLRYALLDDELRPDRAIVRTEKAGGEMAPGGAAVAQLPKAATATAKAEADGPADDD